jgi:hypothetical protein
MQVNWASIERLVGTHTDLWILISSGVIINRLQDKQGKLACLKKLVSYLGCQRPRSGIIFTRRIKMLDFLSLGRGLGNYQNLLKKSPLCIYSD